MGATSGVSLPRGLKPVHIERAVDYIEEKSADLIEVYYEQANLFSGFIGILGTQALHAFSPYKKHKHPDVAQQRFPDLSLNGKQNPPPREALESKGSTRPWAVQAHFDHPGWYLVWRYLVDPTKTVKKNREVVIWRVDVAFLEKLDWKYESSRAGSAGGGRTHTFGLRKPATKLKDAAVYTVPNVVLRGGKPVLSDVDEE